MNKETTIMTPNEFSDFYILWYPQMVKYMAWKTGHYQNAEDLAQKLFADLSTNVESIISDTANRLMWKKAKWTALNSLREKLVLTFDPNPDLSFDTRSNRLSIEAMKHLVTQSQDYTDNDSRFDLENLMEHISTLTIREQEVIKFTVLESRTLYEYAQEHNISDRRAQQIRSKGLSKLRKLLWLS